MLLSADWQSVSSRIQFIGVIDPILQPGSAANQLLSFSFKVTNQNSSLNGHNMVLFVRSDGFALLDNTDSDWVWVK